MLSWTLAAEVLIWCPPTLKAIHHPCTDTHGQDGVLDAEFSKIVAQGSGSVYGIDKSEAMIKAARELCKDTSKTTFEGT